MSRRLSNLLHADEPFFSIAVKSLERASGQRGIDVRLTADIIGKSHQKMRELGLDPAHTTGQELYHALQGLVKLHDSFLAQRLSVHDHGDVQKVLRAIEKKAAELPVPQQTWAVKNSVIKRFLKKVPPKNVMKALNYRSIDSMLKRESIPELLGAARFAENATWHKKYLTQYETLTSGDFETRQIEVIYFDPKKWNGIAEEFVQQTRHTVGHLKELGAILLAPLPVKSMPGITITTLPFVIHYMNEIRMYASYFKTLQMKPDFGNIVAETLLNDPRSHLQLLDYDVHWRVVHRHYGKSGYKDVFGPHVVEDDIAWHDAQSVLYKLESALHFWHDMDYVGMLEGDQPISYNLLDVAISSINNLTYDYRSVGHMQSSLWQELLTRYVSQPSLEHQVIQQLTPEASESVFSMEDF